ncbi:unnamed protein product [Acanthoscelides obtectus]|uniref:Ig-like domain-containing protein n=1 Tax=Acanthoscelides obtectus TaxID=200917 RepID=A0A9P0PUA6_ACAOB|nr:unnamed protein product [Acanthoscelides obtectus]CAK1683288.1 hypothetical protein AOBTE_LOCUS34184 [Acanthoscelides obtectus]
MEEIRESLQKEKFSFILDEGATRLIQNNKRLLKKVHKESPEAHYEWTLNGVFIKPDSNIEFRSDDILIKYAKRELSGLYVCMLYRVNKKKLVLRVVAVAVKSNHYDYDTRATRELTLNCNSVILGYIYMDLSLKLVQNDEVFIDHGTTTLAAVNAHHFASLNESLTGEWKCVVEQKDLKLKWVTNYVRINVKRAPNLFTNLMEDKLTAPIFGWMKTETNVLIGLIMIVVLAVALVAGFLVVYFKFCTLRRYSKRGVRNRRLEKYMRHSWCFISIDLITLFELEFWYRVTTDDFEINITEEICEIIRFY